METELLELTDIDNLKKVEIESLTKPQLEGLIQNPNFENAKTTIKALVNKTIEKLNEPETEQPVEKFVTINNMLFKRKDSTQKELFLSMQKRSIKEAIQSILGAGGDADEEELTKRIRKPQLVISLGKPDEQMNKLAKFLNLSNVSKNNQIIGQIQLDFDSVDDFESFKNVENKKCLCYEFEGYVKKDGKPVLVNSQKFQVSKNGNIVTEEMECRFLGFVMNNETFVYGQRMKEDGSYAISLKRIEA